MIINHKIEDTLIATEYTDELHVVGNVGGWATAWAMDPSMYLGSWNEPTTEELAYWNNTRGVLVRAEDYMSICRGMKKRYLFIGEGGNEVSATFAFFVPEGAISMMNKGLGLSFRIIDSKVYSYCLNQRDSQCCVMAGAEVPLLEDFNEEKCKGQLTPSPNGIDLWVRYEVIISDEPILSLIAIEV